MLTDERWIVPVNDPFRTSLIGERLKCMICMFWHVSKLCRTQDAELERLHELFASVGTLQQPEQDISAAQWLRQHGASERMLAGMLCTCI